MDQVLPDNLYCWASGVQWPTADRSATVEAVLTVYHVRRKRAAMGGDE